jgi:hypothetical protein
MDKKNIVKIYEFIHIVIWIKFFFNNIILSWFFFFFGISEKTKQVKNVF